MLGWVKVIATWWPEVSVGNKSGEDDRGVTLSYFNLSDRI